MSKLLKLGLVSVSANRRKFASVSFRTLPQPHTRPAAVIGDELDAVKASSCYPRVDALH
jgi:hypothetical protein